jgi:hypothetical protein
MVQSRPRMSFRLPEWMSDGPMFTNLHIVNCWWMADGSKEKDDDWKRTHDHPGAILESLLVDELQAALEVLELLCSDAGLLVVLAVLLARQNLHLPRE